MPTRQLALLVTLALLLALAGCSLPTASPTITPVPPHTPIPTASLTSVWVDGGSLLAWRTGDDLPRRIAAGGVIQPWLSPDGQRVAFTRGPGGAATSLWVADVGGVAERQLAGPDTLNSATPAGLRREIGQVAWVSADTLLFNTVFVPLEPMPASGKAADLWRADVRRGAAARLLEDGAGGDFAISPDGQRIALVWPGFYGQEPGRVWLAGLDGTPQRDLLIFEAVATASEYAFYPALHWLPDSSALLVAIPEPDLIYPPEEGAAPRTASLWRLPVEGAPQQLNALPASFFGLPRWSPDGAWLTVLEIVGPREDNRVRLMLAAGDGGNPVSILEGSVGALETPRWSAAGYTYAAPTAGALWLGIPGQAPARIPSANEPAFAPRWADASLLVYASSAAPPYELRAFDRASGLITAIATVNASPPAFDALRLP